MTPEPRRIAIATDAWQPQVNGVVRTLNTTVELLRADGHEVRVIEPGQFVSGPVPFYPEVHLSLPNPWQVDDLLAPFKPDHVHIATEGPIGLTVRVLRPSRLAFQHVVSHAVSRIPRSSDWFSDWVDLRLPEVVSPGRPGRHGVDAEHRTRLAGSGIPRPFLPMVAQGVDLSLFHPRSSILPAEDKPIAMYVGRVSTEKNIEAFLKLSIPGKKYVVGDGPQRAELAAAYPDTVFVSAKTGEELAAHFASADAFVFPSRTDTFGLVILEALASGVPVAAYPVPGPIDIVRPPETGALDDDLGAAVERTLRDRQQSACVALAQEYTWRRCTNQFLHNLVPTGGSDRSFPV